VPGDYILFTWKFSEALMKRRSYIDFSSKAMWHQMDVSVLGAHFTGKQYELMESTHEMNIVYATFVHVC
jgi:hypothetical protein